MNFQGFAMVEVTQDFMHELFKKLDAEVSSLKKDLRNSRREKIELRERLHTAQGDVIDHHSTKLKILDRLERMENRLDLREFAEAQARFEPHP
jgi:hypothetical protein